MPSFKEKNITVLSVIDEIGEDGSVESGDRCEIRAVAYFGVSEGGYTLSYAEEGEGGRVDTLITVNTGNGNFVTVSRHGALESELRFGDGLVYNTLYSAPPYSFDMQVRTVKIRNELTSDGGSLSIIYDMTVGGAKKHVRMKIGVERG